MGLGLEAGWPSPRPPADLLPTAPIPPSSGLARDVFRGVRSDDLIPPLTLRRVCTRRRPVTCSCLPPPQAPTLSLSLSPAVPQAPRSILAGREVHCHLGTGPASQLATIPPESGDGGGPRPWQSPELWGTGWEGGRLPVQTTSELRWGCVLVSGGVHSISGISVGPRLPTLWPDKQTWAQPQGSEAAGRGGHRAPLVRGQQVAEGRKGVLLVSFGGALSAPQRSLEPWACMPCADSYGRANATPSSAGRGLRLGLDGLPKVCPLGSTGLRRAAPVPPSAWHTCSSPAFHLLNTLLTICTAPVTLPCI